MSKIYFTSDQHYGHHNIIRYCARPFTDVNHMNEELIRLHNETVAPNDTVYHLGDFSMNKAFVKPILERLNGEHYLIMGNHDATHRCHHKNKHDKKVNAYALYYQAGFKTISEYDILKIANEDVLLCHLPFSEDHAEFEPRYKEFRPKDQGQFLLCGHVHTAWKIKGRQINVGVDQWDFKPVSLEQIAELIKVKGEIL